MTDLLVFETARLGLVPRSLADTEACLVMDRSPGVPLHIAGPWDDPVAHRSFVEQRTIGPYPPGMGYWTIRLRDQPQEFLGWVLLIPEDAKGPAIEIGWRLRPDYWGQGIAAEAARPLLSHAFQTLGCPRVIADIMPANHGSIRVAEKLGFTPRGESVAPYRRYALAAAAFASAVG